MLFENEKALKQHCISLKSNSGRIEPYRNLAMTANSYQGGVENLIAYGTINLDNSRNFGTLNTE